MMGRSGGVEDSPNLTGDTVGSSKRGQSHHNKGSELHCEGVWYRLRSS